jgi:hypothetical protein
VEVVQADEVVCVSMVESQVDILGGKMECLSGKDLMGYDYISIGKDGFVLISVKSVFGATQLAHDLWSVMMVSKDLEWLSRRTMEYHSYTDDAMGVVKDLDKLGKLAWGFSTMDDLEEVGIGDGVIFRPPYVSAHLNMSQI